MSRRVSLTYLALVLGIALVHGATFVALSASEFARFEYEGAAHYGSSAFGAVSQVLSFPVFLIVRPEWTFWLRPYLGDDSYILLLLAGLNALCWGVVLATLFRWYGRRRVGSSTQSI